MPDRLGDGRLLPAAKPVSSFITPAQIEAQKPASPTRLLASNGGIGLQATAAKPNVPGYNPGQQLGEALQRFGANLTQTLGAGLELYASNEYQQGMNEVAKATALAERQVDQSSVDYAGANRELARVDPLAAMAMDQTNPFRHAGRQRALSQVAAGEIGTALQLEYRNNAGDLVLKDPTDPTINQTKARAVNAVIEKYGLDPSKSGFTEIFLPALNRGWEKVTAQHIQDRNAYLKDTVWRTAGVAGAQVFRQFRQEGKDMGQAAAMVGALLDQEAARMGLPGEAMDMKEKAIKLMRQSLINAGELDAAQAVGGVPIGPADSTGYRQTATQMLQLEMMEDDDKYGEIRRRAKDRELEPVREAMTAEAAALGLQVEDGPAKLQALQGLMNDPRFAALPLGERLDIMGKANKMGEEILGQGFDPSAGDSFIAELDREFGFGSQRDIAGAEARLQEILGQTPQEDRGRLKQRFADWKNKQQKQPWDLINPAINNKIKAELEKHYATTGSAAALRGATNITDVLAWGDATAKDSSARQLAAYRTHVLTRLDEERTKLGRDLSDSEALGVINKALAEYGKGDPDAKAYLFPKIPGSAGTSAEPEKPTAPPGRKPSPVQGYSPTTLDTVPDRAERLKQWQNQPLLSANGTRDLLLQSLNGGQLPAAFKRAAKDAGITPEQLLLKQADFYPNAIKVTPEQRNQLLRKGNQTQAMNNNRQQRGSIDVASLVRQAGSWMVDSVLGVQPAMARTSDIELMRRYSGGGGRVTTVVGDRGGLAATVSAGEGGWNSVNRGRAGDTPGGMKLTGMTIGQVEKLQSQGRVFAVGAYQFTPGVLARARRDAGLSPNERMTPENQTKLFWGLAMGGKRPRLAAYLKGQSNDLAGAHQDLSMEWAGVAGPNGRGYYDGDSAGNRASVGASRVRQALINARRELSGR